MFVFLTFPPCLQLSCHGSYLSLTQVFCPSTLAPLCHLSSGMVTALFQALAFPFWVMWNAPVSPYSATVAHFSLAMIELIAHCYNCLYVMILT